ncbi:MAG: Arc family DNA binding domain-containing protein [Bacteroidetes bacterium]|jgi:hypothetical protein|nr:Arc family DNA binding domain-containing protein [Bacteroidota bacterium]MDF1863455.1 hypothetical protein [Saprospiraceae bacterium]
MAIKKKFVLRIDEKTLAAVEQWASEEFRSVNGQLEWIITKVLKESERLNKLPTKKQSDKNEIR